MNKENIEPVDAVHDATPANVSNRNYGGRIREGGNTVKIASIGDVTIGDYGRNTDISDQRDSPTRSNHC